MNTLLSIHSYHEARQTVIDYWSNYKTPGWPILGIDNEGPAHDWPEKTPHVAIGTPGAYDESKHACNNHNLRFLDTFEFFLKSPLLKSFDNFVLVQQDGLFLAPPPQYPGGFFTHLGAGPMPGLKCSLQLHSPWWVDRPTCEVLVEWGRKLLYAGENEKNSPDCLMGLICDRSGLKWTECNSGGVNRLAFDERREEIAGWIKTRHPWYIHGCWNAAQRDWLMSLL